MWLNIDGVKKNYKSINFTLMKEKLISGEKCQTVRTNFIPYYEEDVPVVIKYYGEPLFLVPIEEYYPKWVHGLTLSEARLDGFSSIEEIKEELMKINNLHSQSHICIVIRWDPSRRIFLEVMGRKGKTFYCKTVRTLSDKKPKILTFSKAIKNLDEYVNDMKKNE